MPLLQPAVQDWLATHHAIISISQLRLLGVGPARRRRLEAEGILLHESKSVRRLAGAPVTLASRCAALCAAHPQGFVTGRTAAELIGLRGLPRGGPITFAVPHGWETAYDPALVDLRQSTKVAIGDIHHRQDGIAIASPWRLAFDLAAICTRAQLVSVIEDILHRRLCGEGALVATARRLAHPNRPGSPLFVSVLMDRAGGAPRESANEALLADALTQRGVPVVAQHHVAGGISGRRFRVDLAVPDLRWGVEVDGHPSHLLMTGTTADKRRDRELHRADWQVERVTPLDLLDLATIADELAELYHARRRRLGAAAFESVGLEPAS